MPCDYKNTKPIIAMKDIKKEFSGVWALSGITFEVYPGEIHCLVGENGAGKSTLMKVLSGAYTPTEGTITVDGKEYSKFDPFLSKQLGINIVYQENDLVPSMDVVENIFVGNEKTKGLGIIDYPAMRKETQRQMNNGGIYMTALQPENEAVTGVARFGEILVEGCYVANVSRWGIAVGYSYAHEQFQGAALKEDVFQKYGHLNIIIRDNYVKAAGGDGITVMYALRPLVKHNTADSVACEMNDRIYSEPGNRLGKVAAAIWPWKCKDALFRYNEVTDTRLNQDGMAYDADSGDGTVYEYNYSRMNEGGCVMFCLEEAIHNTFRHNVSYDDLGGTISPASNPDARLEQNIFYVRDGVPFVRNHMDGGNYTESNDRIIPIEK